MSKPLKKYKKELKSLFNNVPKEKKPVYDHTVFSGKSSLHFFIKRNTS